MAPTPDRPDYISPYPTGPKQFSINPKLTSFDPDRPEYSEVWKIFCAEDQRFKLQIKFQTKLVNMPCDEVITSNNMLIKDNNNSTSSVWEWKASLSPKSREKMSDTPVKEYPDPDRPEIKFPIDLKWNSPTRPENIPKNVPRPRTGFGPVLSGLGKVRVSGSPAGLWFLLVADSRHVTLYWPLLV